MGVFSATEAFEIAMQIEKNGEVFYHAVAVRMTDPSVKKLFQELAAQEQRHYGVFQKMAGTVGGAASPSAPEACPSCKNKCAFTDGTCYTPECGGPDYPDPQLLTPRR